MTIIQINPNFKSASFFPNTVLPAERGVTFNPSPTLPSVMYLQFILRNFSVRASSSSEVDDTTLDWRRGGNAGGRTYSGLGGPSESCGNSERTPC